MADPMFDGHAIRTRYHDAKALGLHEAHPALVAELGDRAYASLAVENIVGWIGYEVKLTTTKADPAAAEPARSPSV